MTPKVAAALAMIGGSITLCGLMAWHLATRHALDLSHATPREMSTAQAATMHGVDTGTAGAGAIEPIPLSVRLADHPAVRYAHAVQDNDCDTVIALTLWMAERLQFVRLNGGDASSLESTRADLCRRLSERRLEEAQWEISGVEDRYVFMPGAELKVLAVEEGRGDLSRDAKECVLFRVSYAAPERALRDSEGLPVRSLEARVWISKEGFVLKASVLGDAEVDPDSFRYDWHEAT